MAQVVVSVQEAQSSAFKPQYCRERETDREKDKGKTFPSTQTSPLVFNPTFSKMAVPEFQVVHGQTFFYYYYSYIFN
jgi:hypothetical protein